MDQGQQDNDKSGWRAGSSCSHGKGVAGRPGQACARDGGSKRLKEVFLMGLGKVYLIEGLGYFHIWVVAAQADRCLGMGLPEDWCHCCGIMGETLRWNVVAGCS